MLGGTRTLKAGELLTLVGELYRNHETGTLVLQGGGTTKYLYFQEGQVVFAASNAPEDKFTHILTEQGQLTEQQLQMAVEKKADRTIGKTLVEMGFLSSADLLHALVMQVHRVALSSLVWVVGEATFKPNVLPAGVARLPISTPRFILDLAQQVENRAWVGQLLGGMETVLKTSSAEREAAITTGLQDEEQRIMDLIDGKRSVRELCEASHVDLFRGAKFCLGLSIAGIAHTSGILHHPQEQATGKSLDLSFLDSMIPSQKAEGAPAAVASPFQAPEPEPAPSPPAAREEAAAPPVFFAPGAFEASSSKADEPATLASPEPPAGGSADFTPSLDPFASAPAETAPQSESVSPPPEPEATRQPMPKFAKAAQRSAAMGPSNPQLFENLPTPVATDTAAAKPVVSRVSVAKRGGNGKGKTLGVAVAVIVLFGGIAGGGYWWFIGRSKAPAPAVTPIAPKPTPPKPVVPPGNPQAPQPAPTAGVKPAASGAPAAPAGAVKPGGTTSAPPTITITVPGVTPQPKPEPPKVAPAQPVTVQPGTVKPPAPPTPTAAVVPVSGAMTLSTPEVRQTLLDGNYGEAAGAFAYQARNTKAAFTINIEVACQPDTITKGLAAAGGSESFFILPYDLKGRACFAVFWGLYPDRPSAEKALATLPAFFKESAQPKVVPWGSVKK